MAKISVTALGFDATENALLAAPYALRKATREALRSAGRVVVKAAAALVPPPGYPGDKPELKPLRDTLAVEVKDGDRAMYAVIGPQRPAGAHGHLVERAHKHVSHGKPTGRLTTPRPFLEPAAAETLAQQRAIIDQILSEMDREIARRL